MKYLVVLCFFLCQLGIAQSFTHFNKQIILDESNQLSVATIPHSEGYYTVGVFGFTHPIIYLAKIDLEGNVLTYHILDDSFDNTTIVTGRQFIETSDENFVLIHTKWVGDNNTDIFMKKISIEGEILWEKQFGGEGIDGTGEVIQTKDGGFLIAGFLATINHTEMYVVKTDSRGVLEWENTYCLNRSCLALSVDITSDGGYILGGMAEIEDNNNDMYVVKINSLGSKKWEKTYGGTRSDPACQIYTLEDGNFLLEGGIRENNIRKNYNAKLDANGEIIWEKIYSINNIRTIQSPLVFREDKGFIGAAFQMKGNIPTPFIMNFDENGNILWTKTITSDPDSHVYITDMNKIVGGYVLTGYKYAPTPQYGWIVTIDEDGNFCEELGCVETVVDIEDIAVEKPFFVQISPNPVRGQATIHYRIPKEGVLKVYDYQGKIMDSWILDGGYSELTLELEDWVNGLYLYSVEMEGERIEGGKLVVE